MTPRTRGPIVSGMIRSMTGFGEARRDTAAGTLQVQIRTVNHRHFNVHLRLPESLERSEPAVTTVLRERIHRGHVRFRLDVTPGAGSERRVQVDHARVRAYLAAFGELKREHELSGEVDLSLLTRFEDILQPGVLEAETLDPAELLEVTRAALEGVIETRETEGRALLRDLNESLEAIDRAVAVIEDRAPERLERERDRLRAAVRELADGTEVDEERLAREIAYLAERWDINEELVRLRSHLQGFRETLESGIDEPAGKRLGFWVQEMHREGNTIGSKANDALITEQVVEIKAAIEKLREQVENVE